jgi:hypothetical protein
LLFGEAKLVLDETPKAISPFGGLASFISFLNQIGFARQVQQHLPFAEPTSNYDWKHRKDPIPDWKRRLSSLQGEADPYKALLLYKNFMDQTEAMRSILSKSAMLLDQHIQQQIDLARGK